MSCDTLAASGRPDRCLLLSEADDGFLRVIKFHQSRSRHKALVAELIGGEIARAAGLKDQNCILPSG